jgi:hypothetical protein
VAAAAEVAVMDLELVDLAVKELTLVAVRRGNQGGN